MTKCSGPLTRIKLRGVSGRWIWKDRNDVTCGCYGMQVKLRGRVNFKLHKISREGLPARLQLEMKRLAECK